MAEIKFTENEIKHLYDVIEEHFFNHNFGTMSKADFEALIFAEYYNHCKTVSEKPSEYSDYCLSKTLGISQSKVRNLKERVMLKQFSETTNDWRDDFIEAAQNAKLDKTNQCVKIIIEDVNVLNEVRNYLESKGWYDDWSLNRKLLTIPIACFLEITIKDEDVSKLFNKETKNKLEKKFKEDNKIIDFLNNSTKDGLIKLGGGLSKEILFEFLSYANPSFIPIKIILDLLKNSLS